MVRVGVLSKDFDGVTELLRQPAYLDSFDSLHRKFFFHDVNRTRPIVWADEDLVKTIATSPKHKRREIVPLQGLNQLVCIVRMLHSCYLEHFATKVARGRRRKRRR